MSERPSHIPKLVARPPQLTIEALPEWMRGPGGRFFNTDGTMKRVGGRPSILTDDVALEIIRNVARCGKPHTAVAALGLKWPTVYRWLERGELGEEPFATFAAAVEMAKAEWAMRQVDKLDASPDHRAAAWLLERMGGDDWRKPESTTSVNVAVAVLPPQPEDSKAVIDAEARVMQEGGGYEGDDE